jgi:hypothetical protein
MNGRDTVTLAVGGASQRARFLGAGSAADLPPFVGAYEVAPAGGGEGRQVRIGVGLNFLWAADAAIDADEIADRIMRTVGLLCLEAHLAGRLKADQQGVLQVRDFIGSRYPEYTSAEMFVASLYDSPGRIERLCREDVLRCLADHADAKKAEGQPTGPGLTVFGILAWPGKRRFYSEESVRDALLGWESQGLVAWTGDRVRIRPDRLDDVRSLLG